MQDQLLSAIHSALAGNWDEAHSLVQEHENDPTAAWIHAVLHKIEGDADNSRYWYQRAGKLEHLPDKPAAELNHILESLRQEP